MQYATKKMTKDVSLNTNPIKSRTLYVAILFLFFWLTFVIQNSNGNDYTDDTSSVLVEDAREIGGDNNPSFDDLDTSLGAGFDSYFFNVVFFHFFSFISTEAQPQFFFLTAIHPRAPPL